MEKNRNEEISDLMDFKHHIPWDSRPNSPFKIAPFYVSILIYGSFSSPTPSSFGWFEFGIVAGIIVFLIVNLRHLMLVNLNIILSVILSIWILFYGFLPSLLGDNEPTIRQYIRDIIPFCFIPLSLVIFSVIYKGNYCLEKLEFVIFAAGLMMALRFIYQNVGWDATAIFSAKYSLGEDYLVVDQVVTFMGLYSFKKLFESKTVIDFLGYCVCVFIFLSFSTQLPLRGNLFLLAICFGLIFRPSVRHVFLGLLLLIFLIFSLTSGYLDPFVQKNLVSGLNNRDAEFLEIVLGQHADTLQFLFGFGFGGQVVTPTGGTGMFTHNIISYTILKFGVIGNFLMFGIFYFFIPKFFSVLKMSPHLSLTILYYLLVQPGFKSLGFVFMLPVLLAHIFYMQQNTLDHGHRDRLMTS